MSGRARQSRPPTAGRAVVIDTFGSLAAVLRSAIGPTAPISPGTPLEIQTARPGEPLPADVAVVVNASSVDAPIVARYASEGALVAIGPRLSTGDPATGIDVLAWLVAGSRAVVEHSAFVLPEVASLVARTRRGVVVGEPAGVLLRLHRHVVDDWPSDDDGDLDPLCFRAALALAQLAVLRPPPGGRRSHGFPQLAIGLNGFRERTGFAHNPDDLRRALARLTRLWTPDDEVGVEVGNKSDRDLVLRSRLPELAREAGFPRQQPEVPGVDRTETGAALYRALEGLVVDGVGQVDGFARAYVQLNTTRPIGGARR